MNAQIHDTTTERGFGPVSGRGLSTDDPSAVRAGIRSAALLIACIAGAAAYGCSSVAAPAESVTAMIPTAQRQEVIGDDYHGTWVPDPYRWLEDQDGAATAAWTSKQNLATEAFLSDVSARGRLEKRLSKLWNYERKSPPRKAGDQWFFNYNDGLKNQSILYASDTPDGAGRVLLDPNSLSSDGTVAVGSTSFSKDGTLLAYSFSKSGSDWREFKVMNVATGEHLTDHLRWTKFSSATWLPDGSGFLYSKYPEPEEGKAYEAANKRATLCLHKIGTDQSEDQVVFSDPEHPDRRGSAQVSDDGNFLVFTIVTGTDARNRVSILDLADLGKAPEPLFAELTASYRFLGNEGRTCYFLTDDNAPRSRIVAVDLDDAKRDSWKEIVPQNADILESARIVGDRIVLVYMRDVQNVVRACDLDGENAIDVTLPGIGSASGFTGRRKDDTTFFQFQSFTRPPSVYRANLNTGAIAAIHQPDVDFDPDAYETRQVPFQSKDGTRIVMFIVHKKNLVLTGDHPTYLYGYGGFNISLKPSFRPRNMAWLELGGIYAQPTLRGGGEFGKEWHEAGMLQHKQNVFDDFVAAAQFLVRNDYTKRSRLAIGGGSNGGLLVGAALTQHPELFGAAIPEVGVLDMLRYHRFTIGAAWIPEYGSSDDPDLFATLFSYSPLHNIQAGTQYPPTLIMTGDHDDRVLPGHSYKFAAALQEAQAGRDPILLRVDSNAGHGAGKPTAKRIAEAADRWSFLVRALNMD